ncbi:MAG: tetratricopeptide repeat protein [Pseudomonadales bacterium]
MADRTEEEQLEAVKNWVKENGMSLVLGITLALGGVFGYQAWQTSVRETGEEASALYDDLVATVVVNQGQELGEEQVSTARFLADQLKSDYQDTTYGHFAAMFMSRVAIEQGDLERAEAELKWALDHDVDTSLAHIVRPRLAAVLLAQGNPEGALALLEGIDAGAYTSSYEEVKGDIFLELGREDAAREAYQKAIDTQVEETNKPILDMKRHALAKPETVIPDDPVGDDGQISDVEVE